MCFEGQLGDALDVVVRAVWGGGALVDGDPIASQEPLESLVRLLW